MPKSNSTSKKKTKTPRRLDSADIAIVSQFVPWWIRCDKCAQMAKLWPHGKEGFGECKCERCGAIYRIPFKGRYPLEKIPGLPLWLKAEFRKHLFWAVNGDHLQLLERVIQADLRERPGSAAWRVMLTSVMPFNLPAWLLSAKNRPDLLRLIEQLRKTIVS